VSTSTQEESAGPMARAFSVALLMCLLISAPTSADPITVAFTVLGSPQDPINGTVTGSGSFSFDSSVVAPGATLFDGQNGLGATSIKFPWEDVHWNRSSADLYLLSFDSVGSLISWGFGGFAQGFNGVSAVLSPDVLVQSAWVGFPTTFFYTTSFGSAQVPPQIYVGSLKAWNIVPPQPIPEPASLALFGTGLVLCAKRRRATTRQRRLQECPQRSASRRAAERSTLVDCINHF
jgi:hypothetical protein